MIQRLKQSFRDADLAAKIRYSYAVVVIPMLVLVIVSLVTTYVGNVKYRDLISSASVAGEFSLDFKEDFDYETYLVVVENKTPEESSLEQLLEDARRIVNELDQLTDPGENKERLGSAMKYLDNLEIYRNRIVDNLREGNKYEENILIWENDIQIVTALIQDTLNEYIFYEIRDIQETRDRLQQMSVSVFTATILAAFIILGLILVFSYTIPRSISRPITEISEVTRQVSQGNFAVRTHIEHGAEVRELGEDLNKMIDRIEELLDQVKVEQIRLRHAELELLQAQINPHFLYNTLDTIVWLAEWGEREKVVSMVNALSRFFRVSLSEGKDNVTIREELQHVRSYLEIQQIRYQDILDYEIEVPECLNNQIIPKITIQPLVENALYHGIKNKRRKGMIRISGEAREDCFVIRVTDDGIGMNEDRLQKIRNQLCDPDPEMGEIFGLLNVNERIRLRMGDDYGVQIESCYGVGTTVTVRLPLTS